MLVVNVSRFDWRAALKKEKQHQQFANEESVRVLDYQQCIQATRTGNGQSVNADCDKVWQEIRSKNTAQ